ncbi:hypothetical protein IQ07DRAFT_583540 [Pyrenochaeta sp. DS3sAY3a]|nr:hypothetical protein IQ07DRAFT_583540 [Pyrenochaeta sp. DS3sAY3a]
MSKPLSYPVEHTTPPSSFVVPPSTPPPTEKKPFFQAQRVVARFEAIQAGRSIQQDPWTEYQLEPGEYDRIEHILSHNKALLSFTKDKIRYDYDLESHRLVVRMPTGVHERFIDRVEDAIRSQLKAIRGGSDKAASFAQKVQPARSTEIFFPAETDSFKGKSKYEPDTSFWHDDAEYPGVIIEVAYSQKRKRLDRLAENYLLDSDASVQVVVGLDVEYGKKGTKKATLSVWRTRIIHTPDGDELEAYRDVENEVFRDEQGKPTDLPGLRLFLSDFACEELTKDEISSKEPDIFVSSKELCQYLDAAEHKMSRHDGLVKHTVVPGVKKRKRSATPPDEINTSDEERYIKEEERATKRVADRDADYEIAC